MFTTICLLFFSGFILWMNTSKRIAWQDKNQLMRYMAGYPTYSRYLAGLLFIIGSVLCVSLLGVGSGLFSAVVILMLAGSVSVLFFPFRYFGRAEMLVLYACCVMLEILFN